MDTSNSKHNTLTQHVSVVDDDLDISGHIRQHNDTSGGLGESDIKVSIKNDNILHIPMLLVVNMLIGCSRSREGTKTEPTLQEYAQVVRYHEYRLSCLDYEWF